MIPKEIRTESTLTMEIPYDPLHNLVHTSSVKQPIQCIAEPKEPGLQQDIL